MDLHDISSPGDGGRCDAFRLLTVDDLRAAVSRVARGDFGVSAAPETDRTSFDAADSSDGDCSSAALLDDWARAVSDADRIKAVQTARLAAFVLSRVLKRPDGENELDDFLAAPESPVTNPDPGPTGTTFGAGSFDDPRLSTRARALLAPEDAVILAAKMRTRLETARRAAARAVVAFVGFHNLLASAAEGRLPFERVDRLHFRVDDALLPLTHVQALDGCLDGLDEKLSMGQFEKQARMRIRTLTSVKKHPDAARKNRCVRIERRDDDTAIPEMVGPLAVIEALYQRLRAMARAIHRHEIGALGLTADGRSLNAKDVLGRVQDDRRTAELIFDLLAGARPQTQVRIGPLKTKTGDHPDGRTKSADGGAVGKAVNSRGSSISRGGSVSRGGQAGGSRDDQADGSRDELADEQICGAELAEGSLIDVLCPTDGDWLRKQAAVTITVPLSTILSLDDAPGRINGDTPLGAANCREAAAHATSWTRVLTDPATSIVTDHIAHTYEPTAAMRRTIRQKWRTCTAPGCSRPAVECEIEHCCRFSKANPRSGGLTVMENLHVMCKHHHELKTRGIIRLTRLSRNEVAWALPMGVEAVTAAPPLSTGVDPPDPRQLRARAEDLDSRHAGGEGNGGDLFTLAEEEPPSHHDDSHEGDPPPF